jgi:hypothetical protein
MACAIDLVIVGVLTMAPQTLRLLRLRAAQRRPGPASQPSKDRPRPAPVLIIDKWSDDLKLLFLPKL